MVPNDTRFDMSNSSAASSSGPPELRNGRLKLCFEVEVAQRQRIVGHGRILPHTVEIRARAPSDACHRRALVRNHGIPVAEVRERGDGGRNHDRRGIDHAGREERHLVGRAEVRRRDVV